MKSYPGSAFLISTILFLSSDDLFKSRKIKSPLTIFSVIYFSLCENISIDNAIMEKTDLGVVLPLNAGWSDIGSWQSMWEVTEKNQSGNAIYGNVILDNVSNSFFKSTDRLIVGIGLKDIVVVETIDAILISHKDQSHAVKNIVQNLEAEGKSEANTHKTIYRPWGHYTSIAFGVNWQVKEIIVKSGESLSLQLHNHRTEHWINVSGIGLVEINDQKTILNVNESIYILLHIRNKRKKPFTDEKILTSWNSLTINSLIEYYKISRNSHYLDSAEKSILFLIDNMLDRTKLNATYKNGKSHIDAYLDDYVFLINAILNFLSLKWNDKLFKKIIVLADVLIDKFLDFSDGGFYFTSKEHEALIQKPKPTADEAFPSGNSLASKIFIKLGFLINNTKYIDAADSIFSYASKQVNDSPNAHSSLLDNYLLMNKPIITIILKTGENTDEIDLWLDLLIDLNKPYISYFYISNNNTGLKNIDDKIALGNVTAYICEGFTCEKPINDINEFSGRISLL